MPKIKDIKALCTFARIRKRKKKINKYIVKCKISRLVQPKMIFIPVFVLRTLLAGISPRRYDISLKPFVSFYIFYTKIICAI